MGMKRCIPCLGSGFVMGGGKLQADCHWCNGSGKVIDVEENRIEAINEIKSLDKNMTEKQAQKIFDREMKRLDKKEKKGKIYGEDSK